MASNLRSFNLAVQKHGEEIPARRMEQIHRAVGLEALRGVVLMSPVDTGRFRGNWQQTLGSPASGTLEVLDKSGGPTITAGEAVLSAVPAFSVTWLVNNLDYAVALEKGHSKQAPRGMLAVTAARLRSWLARVR